MSTVLAVVVGIVIAVALLIVYVWVLPWARDSRTTRFVFEDRDTYLFLKVDRPLGSGESSFLAMRALREALRLKLAGVGYQRLLVEVSGLRLANTRAFWLLIGALGPALGNENVKLAVVCRRRTPAAKHFRGSGILNPFPSFREGERYLRSAEPPQRVLLDQEQLDDLLVPGRRKRAG